MICSSNDLLSSTATHQLCTLLLLVPSLEAVVVLSQALTWQLHLSSAEYMQAFFSLSSVSPNGTGMRVEYKRMAVMVMFPHLSSLLTSLPSVSESHQNMSTN